MNVDRVTKCNSGSSDDSSCSCSTCSCACSCSECDNFEFNEIDQVGRGRDSKLLQTQSTVNSAWLVEELPPIRNQKFNQVKIPFRVVIKPDALSDIENFDDYLRLINELVDHIMDKMKDSGVSKDDFVNIMLKPLDYTVPIETPLVPLKDFDLNILLNEVDRHFQSNDGFNITQSFVIYGQAIMEPKFKGDTERDNDAITNALRVIQRHRITIKVKGGWCLPAAIFMGKLIADGGNHRKYRNTERDSFLTAVKAFADPVVQSEDQLQLNGAPFALIQSFQDHIGNQYRIKVYRDSDPERGLIWTSQLNPSKPMTPKNDMKHINILMKDGHFDVISKIWRFFDSKSYCHECDKPVSHPEYHRCYHRCFGCYRPIELCRKRGKGDSEIHCFKCNRWFPHKECYDEHARVPDVPNGKSKCERNYYCPDCFAFVRQKGKRIKKHTCGEIYCVGCKCLMPRNHKCFIKPIHPPSDNPDGVHTDIEAISIEEMLVRRQEQADGIVIPPTDTELLNYRSHGICFFDCEAFVDSETAQHMCNLVVAQYKDGEDVKELIFRGTDAMPLFCSWVFQKAHKNWTFLAHNAKRYDNYFVMNHILKKMHRLPEIIAVGGSVLEIKYKPLGIRFIDSINFLPAGLAKLPAMVGMDAENDCKGFFPHTFNLPCNYDYDGPMPGVQYYEPDKMDEKRRDSFLAWYNECKANNHQFKFWNELIRYCQQDVKVLRKCVEKFRHEFFSLSNVDPLKYITLASACSAVYRRNFMPEDTIGIIPPNGYFGHDNTSRKCLVWLEYLGKSQNKIIQHAWNGGEFSTKLSNGRKVKFDGKCDNDIYEFYGCYFHGCPKCYTSRGLNVYHQEQTETVHQKTLDREADIRNLTEFKLTTLWEHEFDEMVETNDDFANFVASCDIEPPLQPRDAFFGGRTEAIRTYGKSSDDQQLFYGDINSLYPYVQKTQWYPIGHCDIIQKSAILDNNIEEYFGLIKCKVIPPYSMYLPALPSRINGKLMFVLCRTCAETQQSTTCTHSDEERALTGTWCSPELQLAVNLGYRISTIYEIWNFREKSNTLFAGYVKLFLKEKLQAKGFPDGVETEVEKTRYIREIERLEGVTIDRDKVSKNSGRYLVAKLCLNTLWGKFGQRENLPQTRFIENSIDLWNMMISDEFSIRSVSFPTESLAQVTYRKQQDFVMPGLNTNVAIAAFTTCWARLKLYESVLRLDKSVLYMDTDSIIFSKNTSDEGYWPPIGEELGAYKDEIGSDDKMVEFACCGPKNYAYRTEQGKVCMKVKGITLNTQTKKTLTFETITQLAVNYRTDDKMVIDMGKQFRRSKDEWSIVTVDNKKSYRMNFDKRILRMSDNFFTYPWGFVPDVDSTDITVSFPLASTNELNITQPSVSTSVQSSDPGSEFDDFLVPDASTDGSESDDSD